MGLFTPITILIFSFTIMFPYFSKISHFIINLFFFLKLSLIFCTLCLFSFIRIILILRILEILLYAFLHNVVNWIFISDFFVCWNYSYSFVIIFVIVWRGCNFVSITPLDLSFYISFF